MDRIIELAWAAGFFDGEGTTVCYEPSAKRRGRIIVAVPQREHEDGSTPAVLQRFRAAVGVGRIGGPYRSKNPRQRPIYKWYATLEDAITTVEALWPYLGEVKRAQALRAIRRSGVRCPTYEPS